MNQKIIPVTKPTIEDVRDQFEQWRKARKHRSPIPANLWEGAVSLVAEHSINTVSRSLRIGYTPLKRRVLAVHELQLLLWNGDPSHVRVAPPWRKIDACG